MDLHPRYSFSVHVILVVLIASAWAKTSLGASNLQFTFFFHDNLLTVNASAYLVTQPIFTAPAGSHFGALVTFDDSLTIEPDPNSLEIGRGRGLYLFDANDNKGPGLQLVWTAQFNATGYGDPGSTLSFAGFERIPDQTREVSITGGTGSFRYARGYAVITTYSEAGVSAILNITANFTYGL